MEEPKVELHAGVPAFTERRRVPELLQRTALEVDRQGEAEVDRCEEEDEDAQQYPPLAGLSEETDEEQADGDLA